MKSLFFSFFCYCVCLSSKNEKNLKFKSFARISLKWILNENFCCLSKFDQNMEIKDDQFNVNYFLSFIVKITVFSRNK